MACSNTRAQSSPIIVERNVVPMTEVVGMVKLKTLGGLVLEPDGFRQPKPLAMLAYLALEGPQRRAALAKLCWPEGNSHKSLSMALTRLRQAAPTCFSTDGDLITGSVRCDAVDLLGALAAGDVGKAVELYSGAFLDGVESDDWSAPLESWVANTRDSLAIRLRSVLIGRAEALSGAGQEDEAAGVAAAAWRLAGAPPPEPSEGRRLYALLDAALHPAAADVLADLRSLEPDDEQGVLEGRWETEGSRFIGREKELALVAAQLERPDCRLITIVGPGGVGKTRLALRVSTSALGWGSFPDGVHYVKLETLTEPDQVPALLCQTLGAPLRSAKDGWQHLRDVIGGRRILLLLDNAEHLLTVAPALAELVESTSGLKLLITSRERLAIGTERVVTISGLAWPDQKIDWTAAQEWPAVEMLCDRAAAVLPGIDLRQQQTGVLELCASLGGLPLGLELAASLLRLMPAQDLARLVASDPTAIGAAAPPGRPKHASLQTVLEASWQVLPEASRRAAARLSVFSGGFGAETAQEVCEVDAKTLSDLVDSSWLQRGAGRFDIHPYVHAFLRRRLVETPEEEAHVLGAHALWCLSLARSVDRAPASKRKERTPLLAAEHANLMAALGRLSVSTPELGLELATLLTESWLLHGRYAEGLDRLTTVLKAVANAITPESRAVRARALSGAGQIAWRRGERERPRSLFEEALAELDALDDIGSDSPQNVAALRAGALVGLGLVFQDLDGDFAAAERLYLEALKQARRSGEQRAISEVLRLLSVQDSAHGDYVSAKQRLGEALALSDEAGDELSVAKTCINLATVLGYSGDAAAARPLNERALNILQVLGDLHGQAVVLINLGVAASERGDEHEGLRHYRRGLALFRELGERRSVCHLLNNIAGAHQTLGEPLIAKPLLEESLELLRTLGEPALTTHALSLYAKVLIDLGERDAAKRQLDACIFLARRNDERWALMRALVTLAKWHAAADQSELAMASAREAEAMAEAAGDAKVLRSVREFMAAPVSQG